jgi:hypothetical protein
VRGACCWLSSLRRSSQAATVNTSATPPSPLTHTSPAPPNRCGDGSLAAFLRAKKKPLWRQSEVIPKVNLIEMFEIPACRSTQGRPFTSTTNMSRQVFLSPFRKTSLPVLITLFSLIQEYPSADRHAAHQCFSLSVATAEYTVINGVSRDATLGVFQSIPGHPTRQRIELPSLAPPRLVARFSPDNSQEALGAILSRICADGQNSHPLGIG